jgi:peptidoglycan/xylan/chitin deacetylase (PgdA/CDA1 family)
VVDSLLPVAAGSPEGVRVIVLLYHDVIQPGRSGESGFSGAGAARYKIPVRAFRDHLAALARILPARVIGDDGLAVVPANTPVLFTFDDGGVSAVDPIADLLEQHGWRGHFFVTTDHLGTPGFLSAAQVRQLNARGHIIGSHSCSHPARMSYCAPDEIDREWSLSCRALADVLGVPITTASVPGGYYSRRVGAAAAAAGVKVLFNSEPTTRTHTEAGCRVVGRYSVYDRTLAADVVGLVSSPPWRRMAQYVAWQLKKAAKAVGGTAYQTVRERACALRYPRL